MTAEWEWFEVDGPAPRWARRVAVSPDRVLFVPAAIAAISDMEAFLCAGYDGTPCVMDDDHAYYPAEWMSREWPICAGTVARIKERLGL